MLVGCLAFFACDASAQAPRAEPSRQAAPPPAPMASTSRDDVVRMLRSGHAERCLPFTIATQSPEGVIRLEGGQWVLRWLVLDAAAAEREGRRRRAAGEPWMPEHAHAFLSPGPVVARGSSAAALASAIEQLSHWRGPTESDRPRDLCPPRP